MALSPGPSPSIAPKWRAWERGAGAANAPLCQLVELHLLGTGCTGCTGCTGLAFILFILSILSFLFPVCSESAPDLDLATVHFEDALAQRDLGVFRIGLYIIDRYMAQARLFAVRLAPYF